MLILRTLGAVDLFDEEGTRISSILSQPKRTALLVYLALTPSDGWAEPELLPPDVNSTTSKFNAFVAPDESYLILSTAERPDGQGGADYYVCFRDADDHWTEPINLGDAVNSPPGEFSPYVSPDGRYFFFMSTRRHSLAELPDTLTADALWRIHTEPGNGNADIYWIDAGFMEGLRPGGGVSDGS